MNFFLFSLTYILLNSILPAFLHAIPFPDQLFRNKSYEVTRLPAWEKLPLIPHHPVITVKTSFARLKTTYFTKPKSFWALHSEQIFSSNLYVSHLCPHINSHPPTKRQMFYVDEEEGFLTLANSFSPNLQHYQRHQLFSCRFTTGIVLLCVQIFY